MSGPRNNSPASIPESSKPAGRTRRLVWVASVALIAAAAVVWLNQSPKPAPCESIKAARMDAGRCVVTGNLTLEGHVQTLPDAFTVKGDLILRGTQIEALPQDLIVEGNLMLYKTLISNLPAGLRVDGNLDVYGGIGSPGIRCTDILATVKGKKECNS